MATLVYYQLYVFLATFYGGVVIGLMYDIYKVYRGMLKTRKIIAVIQDFLFWIIVSIVAIYVLVYSNDGEIRGYSLIGFILGALTYNLLLSMVVVRTIEKFLNVIKKLFLSIYNKIKKVCSFIYKSILFPFKKVYKVIQPLIIRLRKILSMPKRMINEIKKYSKTLLSKK